MKKRTSPAQPHGKILQMRQDMGDKVSIIKLIIKKPLIGEQEPKMEIIAPDADDLNFLAINVTQYILKDWIKAYEMSAASFEKALAELEENGAAETSPDEVEQLKQMLDDVQRSLADFVIALDVITYVGIASTTQVLASFAKPTLIL